MVNKLRKVAFVMVVAFFATGCFKKVTTDTTLRIKVLSEETSGGGTVAAEGCYAYLYYTEKEDWVIASYEDAAAKIITHPETGETRSVPDGESELYQAEGSDVTYLSLFQGGSPALVVVVYPEAQMFAYNYRKAEAINLHYTYLTLIFHKWKTESYTEGSKDGYKWTVVPTPTTENE